MDFVQHGEPGDLTASLRSGLIQCLQHAVDVSTDWRDCPV